MAVGTSYVLVERIMGGDRSVWQRGYEVFAEYGLRYLLYPAGAWVEDTTVRLVRIR